MARERRGAVSATSLALTAAVLAGCSTSSRPEPPGDPTPTAASRSALSPAPDRTPAATAEGLARGLVYWAAPRASTGEPQLRAERFEGTGSGRTALLAAAREVTAGAPVDPDYRSLWHDTAVEKVRLWWDGDEGYYDVRLAKDTPTSRTPGTSVRQAHLAIQQVVWTLRSVGGVDAPVVFHVGGHRAPVTNLLGIPATGPYDGYLAAHYSGVLGKVNILDIAAPTSDGTVVVRGLAESFEGTVGIDVRGPDASAVLRDSTTAAGCCGRLLPWRYDLDTSGWAPGEYVIEASTDDPVGVRGGSDGAELDIKTFTIED